MAETTTRPVARAGCETVESRSCKKGRRQGARASRGLAGAFPGEPFSGEDGNDSSSRREACRQQGGYENAGETTGSRGRSRRGTAG